MMLEGQQDSADPDIDFDIGSVPGSSSFAAAGLRCSWENSHQLEHRRDFEPNCSHMQQHWDWFQQNCQRRVVERRKVW